MSEASRPLDGKVAIITGGGSGIGKATARLLASRGAKVAVTGRTVANLTKTVSELEAAGGQAMAVAMDVSNEESIANGIAQVVDQFGRSEEHTSELQSLMRISYAVFCLQKKTVKTQYKHRV